RLRFMLWSSLGQNELQTGLSPRGKVKAYKAAVHRIQLATPMPPRRAADAGYWWTAYLRYSPTA
ncbi:hypothetical protein, partial [Bradyrhizobium sp. SZCCHNS3051]|uniref:hypothetical protein n=1 Tax=Bradyrhizobium sp. SZCCHNS3051 TaxID=3057320 RepID=UPI0029168BE6